MFAFFGLGITELVILAIVVLIPLAGVVFLIQTLRNKRDQ